MLLQFSVENYKSFKERAILSLEASSDKEYPDHVVKLGNDRILKSIAIFGANASGKSNIFEALTTAILLVRQSNIRQVGEPLSRIVPFKFDERSCKAPSSFEFVFYNDGKKYIYGFSATVQKVIDEYLYVYNTSKPSIVFKRANTNDFKFTSPAIRNNLKPLIDRNTDNKLFLATATMWNAQETIIPYMWFDRGINTYSTDYGQLLNQTGQMYENDNDHSLQRFVNHLLHEADINISDFEVEIKDVSREQILQNFPPDFRPLLSTVPMNNNKSIKIETIHQVEKDGKQKEYRLLLQEESQGTQSLFQFAPILKRAFENAEVICIDEFDTNLHPFLERYLFSLFNKLNVNKANAQLIVSTHSMALMSPEVLRRDQIYFVEKNFKSGESELFSLDDFSARKGENYRKAYFQGRYGAVPFIDED